MVNAQRPPHPAHNRRPHHGTRGQTAGSRTRPPLRSRLPVHLRGVRPGPREGALPAERQRKRNRCDNAVAGASSQGSSSTLCTAAAGTGGPMPDRPSSSTSKLTTIAGGATHSWGSSVPKRSNIVTINARQHNQPVCEKAGSPIAQVLRGVGLPCNPDSCRELRPCLHRPLEPKLCNLDQNSSPRSWLWCKAQLR